LSVAARKIQAHQLPYLDLIPVLAGEGILSLLLETLFTLREALVPIPLSDVDLRIYLLPLHRVPFPSIPPLAIRSFAE
jgi:hypothetical protein